MLDWVLNTPLQCFRCCPGTRFNAFVPNTPFLYPLKTSENPTVQSKGALETNALIGGLSHKLAMVLNVAYQVTNFFFVFSLIQIMFYIVSNFVVLVFSIVHVIMSHEDNSDYWKQQQDMYKDGKCSIDGFNGCKCTGASYEKYRK